MTLVWMLPNKKETVTTKPIPVSEVLAQLPKTVWQRVVVADDLLATGGTISAAADLVRQLGGEIVELAFLIELTVLNGRDRLKGLPVFSLLQY